MLRILAALLLAVFCAGATSADQPPSSLNQIVGRIVAQEQAEVRALSKYSPVIEVYIQNFRAGRQKKQIVLAKDSYFLGRAVLSRGVQAEPLAFGQTGRQPWFANPRHGISVSLLYPDRSGFDQRHYRFDYVRREFLGDVRCLVFDVTPLTDGGRGRFLGRIWVEDQDFHVVRFDGIETGASWRTGVHFDSWRVNAGPDLWLPAYVYTEGGSPGVENARAGTPAFKVQTRFWGYQLSERGPGAPSVKEVSDAALLSRMENLGLLAPAGEADAELETLLSALNRPNQQESLPSVHCRVMLVSALEAFTLGDTIIVSRGLLEAAPDPATRAVILAHELGYILTVHPPPARYAAFARNLGLRHTPASHFGFAYDAQEIAGANRTAEELLAGSPYADDPSTQIFFQALQRQAANVPALVSPALLALSPARSPLELASAAASLAPGAGRLAIQPDPWNDRLKPVVGGSPGPSSPHAPAQPFELAPAAPYLVRLSSAP